MDIYFTGMAYTMLHKKIKNHINRLFLTPDKVKLVVLGNQKSGTTVIAALLSEISDIAMSNDPLYMMDWGTGQTAQELIANPEGLQALCDHRPEYFSQKIIKDPDFVFIYPSLRKMYTSARFVFVVRDPRDTIRSICNRLALDGRLENVLPKAADMKGGNHHWELILSGRLPPLHTRKDGLGFIEHLAHRWNCAVQIYLENKADMLLVKYEDFLRNKEGFIKQLAGELDIPDRCSIADKVNIQYQPKGNPNVRWLEFFGENNLASIENICAEFLPVFGYE